MLHDKNMVSVIDLVNVSIISQMQLNQFKEDIEGIYYKNFSQEGASKTTASDGEPPGTLILTAEGNSILYTAELYNFPEGLIISKNRQLVFKKDKTPKLLKFLDNENFFFLVNKTAPYLMYAIKLEAFYDPTRELEMQARNKRFSYIYETSLSFAEKLTDPVDFD